MAALLRAAVPFIQVDPNTKALHVTDDARRALSGISTGVSVCAVAGVYRTGKSYILNQLAEHERAFGTGSTVQACTKGIWMFLVTLQTGTTLVLLDTEGLQSIDQTEGHDANIFCLALLLSSFFVYNSEKAINSGALDQLSLVAQLTTRIRVHAQQGDDSAGGGGGGGRLQDFFPRFVWLLRDFQLKLQDAHGEQVTPDQYLEECLQPQPGASAAVAEQNVTRGAVRELFERRSCIALPHPTLGTELPESALKELPPLAQLAEGFQEGVTELKRRVHAARAKVVNGTALTGVMLLSLAESYVKAISEGAVPTISTAWASVLRIESGKAIKLAVTQYREGANAVVMATPTPSRADWLAHHERLVTRAGPVLNARS